MLYKRLQKFFSLVPFFYFFKANNQRQIFKLWTCALLVSGETEFVLCTILVSKTCCACSNLTFSSVFTLKGSKTQQCRLLKILTTDLKGRQMPFHERFNLISLYRRCKIKTLNFVYNCGVTCATFWILFLMLSYMYSLLHTNMMVQYSNAKWKYLVFYISFAWILNKI